MTADLYGWIDDLTLDEVESHPAYVRWAYFRALGWIVDRGRWRPARLPDHARVWS